MSEIMLHGVLNMPPELWNDASPIDVMQRHARYVQASKCIDELERELAAVTKERDRQADIVKQFIHILDITEESDSGRLFHPTNITSCRAGDLQKAGELVEELRRASRNQPTP